VAPRTRGLSLKELRRLEAAAIRSTAALASGSADGASLVILLFHRVLAEPDPLLPSEPDAALFERQMQVVAQCFRPLPLSEGISRLRAGSLPRRAVCVTFDDGYANNLEVAAPILLRLEIPATVYVATDFADGGLMFNDTIIEAIRSAPADLDLRDVGLGHLQLCDSRSRIAAIDAIIQAIKYEPSGVRIERLSSLLRAAQKASLPRLMMTEPQIRTLRRLGFEIGAHSATHPILRSISHSESVSEIHRSKERLEGILGESVRSFAYPNGKPGQDFDLSHVGIARDAGFDFALTTSWGAASRLSPAHQLPRISPWDQTAARFALRISAAYRQRHFHVAQ